ncbi:MAG TPA: DNA repair protein RadA [Capsulimonadaceae bacterium]|nr:DNA repair protein RadA [Capsulimonadaceae bacterium]
MPKTVTRFVCRGCGYEAPKWLGRCPGCDEWGTLDEMLIAAPTAKSGLGGGFTGKHGNGGVLLAQRSLPKRLADVPSPAQEGRASTGIGEFDRVLGGGIVPGALILIGGDPGIGKSTLLTQMAGYLSTHGGRTLYISGEESAPQIKRRAERLGLAATSDLLLQNETDISLVDASIRDQQPAFVIVDSIQTMAHPEVESTPGNVWQVRACTAALAQIAKGESIPIFLVGHVTKEGTLAGPRVLEHMVDTVLSFEGDRHSIYRILRANKNRFGSTDELGIFEMHEEGLTEVPNPSEFLLSERAQHTVGSVVTATVEGSRPLLLEVQALIAPSYMANPRRSVTGMDTNRIHLILAVLEKRVGLRLANQDVFVNVAGGVRVEEPAADLAVALACASHLKDVPVDAGVIAVGEVGLAGEVRAASHIEKRLREAARMGFSQAIVSAKNKTALRGKTPDNMRLVGVENVHQAVEWALRPGARSVGSARETANLAQ